MANFNGTSGNDVINGTNVNDNINGLGGNDTLYGNAGNDRIDGGAGNDFLDGGLNDDDLQGGTGNDTLLGGDGNDSLDGGANDDYLDAGIGDNRLWGGTGIDTLLAGSGNDDLDGGADDDYLDASSGDNRLWGGTGADVLLAGSGNDRLDGGADNDFLDAGAGDNELWGGTGNDTLLSGSGNDTANGGANDDYVDAGSGNNALSGGTGDDTLVAGSGNDTVDGGADDDLLDAGGGNDVVFGATGNDTFVFNQSENAGATDDYDGGDGIDTLRLDLTLAERLDPALQLDLVNFFAFLAVNTNSSGEATNADFHFTAFDLTVDQIEHLELIVDGNVVDPHDAFIFGDTDANLTEDDTFPATGTLTVLDIDSGEAHTQAVLDGVSLNGYGTYSVDSDGHWSYTLDNSLVQDLDSNDQISDSFVVFSLDGTASAIVTVTITGEDDGPTFSDGPITTDIGGDDDFGRGVVLQADGKILLAGSSFNGSSFDFTLTRYNPDGSLDTTFGAGGIVTTSFSSFDDHGFSVAVDSSGRIIVAGYQFESGGVARDFAVVRYNADGSLDTSFGAGGTVITDVLIDDVGQSVIIQPDGKILVSGHSYDGSSFDFTVVRYNVDGSLDTSFSGDGKVATGIAFHDASYSIALQSDGKIVAAGHSFTGLGPNDFAVVRYNADGSLDTTFSGDGKVTTDFGGINDVGQSVAVQADGKIVVAGYSFTGSSADFAVARYNADGSLDTSFDGDGWVKTSFAPGNDFGVTVALQADGKILVAGNSFNGTDTDFAIVRYNVDGSLDTTFGGDGKVTTQIGASSDDGFGIVVQPDGKIVVSGSSFNGTDYDFAVARYNPDGSLDTGFPVVTLTTADDTVVLPIGTNTVFGTLGSGATLNNGDSLTGGGGTDTLSIAGAGAFDLNNLAVFTGFEAVSLTGTGQSLTLANGQSLSVNAGSNNTVTLGTGNDTVTFAAGTNFDNQTLGANLSGSSQGGNNTLIGGDNTGAGNASNLFYGDANTMSGTAQGGADTLTGGNNSGNGTGGNGLIGDANTMSGSAQGGADTLTGGNNSGDGAFGNSIYGDANVMYDTTVGGNDVLTGGDNTANSTVGGNTIIADAYYMYNSANGGDDTLIAGSNSGGGNSGSDCYADAVFMYDTAVGGNDTLTGGTNSGSGHLQNDLRGEGYSMSGSSHGGNDIITGGDNTGTGSVTNFLLYGDALLMSDTTVGGNDTLTGGSSSGGGSVANNLSGDADSMSGSAQSGNDILVAGTASAGSTVSNYMWGDAASMSPTAVGGQDTFVFKDNGSSTVGTQNFIADFSQAQNDKIEFIDVAGVTSFNDLVIIQSGADTVVTAGLNQVTLLNYDNTAHQLTASDFLFF